MTDLRKATTSAYNNSEIQQFGTNGTMQFLGYVVDQLTGHGESTEKKFRRKTKRARKRRYCITCIKFSFLWRSGINCYR